LIIQGEKNKMKSLVIIRHAKIRKIELCWFSEWIYRRWIWKVRRLFNENWFEKLFKGRFV